MNDSYRSAGVDVEAGYRAVSLIKGMAQKTFIPGVVSDIGNFGGMFEIGSGYKNPVLVSSTDGVGTKLRIAFIMDIHDTIGQDCVAMCVNDIICSGAKPLFFLDYIACGKNKPERIAEIVKGVVDGCVLSSCALIGGETAEMPSFYKTNEYDIAGFCVGIVEKHKIIDGGEVASGDVLIGIASSGLHSNGYSLVRKVFRADDEKHHDALFSKPDMLDCTLGEELLKPTKIYAKAIQTILDKFKINAISHITGGGFIENIPRMLPNDMNAVINTRSFIIPKIFKFIEEFANIPMEDMYNTFNMGIGMVLAVSENDADKIINVLHEIGEKAYIIGEVVNGDNGVTLL